MRGVTHRHTLVKWDGGQKKGNSGTQLKDGAVTKVTGVARIFFLQKIA